MHACGHTPSMTKCLLQLPQPAAANGRTLALRSMLLDGDESEDPSPADAASNGSILFLLTASCLEKEGAQKGTDLYLKRKAVF